MIAADVQRADGAPFPSDTLQTGVPAFFGFNDGSPREGVSLLALSTGTARTPAQPGYAAGDSFSGVGQGTAPPRFPADSLGCPASPEIYDDVALTLTLRAPDDAQAFSFAFKFLSHEYPDHVCSTFADQFVVLVDPAPAGSVQGNVALDPLGNPIGVNNELFKAFSACTPTSGYLCPLGTGPLGGTGFDNNGATGWLETTVPITGGQEFTLRFIIWDGGDDRFDSTALIDAFEWLDDAEALVTEPE